MMRHLGIVLALLLAAPATGAAQRLGESALGPDAPFSRVEWAGAEPSARPAHAAASAGVIDGVRSWAGLAKWVSLAGTGALAGLGFAANQDAEEAFQGLEALCATDPNRCRFLNPDGSYQDPEAESLFQEVVDRDRKARAYLVGSQITLAATVVLFILDLKNDSGPDNIPYDPASLRLSVAPGEVKLAWTH